MYSNCLFCHAPLGANDAVEHFPVGRRLAFDAAKGRLWVVCGACRQWCLSPLEERWEAIEECERIFRAVRARVSTGEIGLARLASGVELIRVGAPLRPEFAAWRFGAQFLRRQRSAAWLTAGGAVGATGVGLLAAGLVAPIVPVAMGMAGLLMASMADGQPRPFSAGRPVRLTASDGHVLELGRDDLGTVGLRPGAEPGSYRVAVDYADVSTYDWRTKAIEHRHVFFDGADARRAARLLLPRANAGGGGAETVADAVADIERAGGAAAGYVDHAFSQIRRAGLLYSSIASYPAPIRLALEMTLHEEDERRAMAGELAELEAAWREAEEVAAIADALLLPPGVDARVARMRAQLRSRDAARPPR